MCGCGWGGRVGICTCVCQGWGLRAVREAIFREEWREHPGKYRGADVLQHQGPCQLHQEDDLDLSNPLKKFKCLLIGKGDFLFCVLSFF